MKNKYNQIRYKSVFFLFHVFLENTTDIPYIFIKKQ